MTDYPDYVRDFTAKGAAVYRTDPAIHYRSGLGLKAKRPMEPGFIPVDTPAKVVTVSLFPNESESSTPEFQAHRRSLAAWGGSGSVRDYTRAYRDWVAMLQKVYFYRDFNTPIFEALGIASNRKGSQRNELREAHMRDELNRGGFDDAADARGLEAGLPT